MSISSLLSFLVGNSGSLAVISSATSTSTTTGALVVAGGVGVGGPLYANSVFDSSTKLISDRPRSRRVAIFGDSLEIGRAHV